MNIFYSNYNPTDEDDILSVEMRGTDNVYITCNGHCIAIAQSELDDVIKALKKAREHALKPVQAP